MYAIYFKRVDGPIWNCLAERGGQAYTETYIEKLKDLRYFYILHEA